MQQDYLDKFQLKPVRKEIPIDLWSWFHDYYRKTPIRCFLECKTKNILKDFVDVKLLVNLYL